MRGYDEKKHMLAVEKGAEVKTWVVSIPKGELNIRAEKSLNAGIVGQVENGTIVSILSGSDNWYFIEDGGISGHVLEKYNEIK